MRVVLDTNVYISSLVFKGKAREVYDYCIETSDVFTSDFIMGELSEKLYLKFDYPKVSTRNLIKSILSVVEKRNPHTKRPNICRDMDDNYILQLCESVSANYLITGDKDLLILKNFKQTEIISPVAFIANLV